MLPPPPSDASADQRRRDGASEDSPAAPRQQNPPPASSTSIFTIPPAVKRLFDRFPLRTYPPNTAPVRLPIRRDKHALYIFTTAEGEKFDALSFNPACLKWQMYLRFYGIECTTVASNNHASPNGALPFLLPTSKSRSASNRTIPIPSNKIQGWAGNNMSGEASSPSLSSARLEAYLSLVDYPIRRAWLHSLYQTRNLHSLAAPLYIHPTTTSRLLHASLTRDLRLAATKELRSSSYTSPPSSSSLVTTLLNATEVSTLYRDAAAAFAALATLLGDSEYFTGAEMPGVLDAAVFAYTHLLMLRSDEDETETDEMAQSVMGVERWRWTDTRLTEILVRDPKLEKLRRHRDRVLHAFRFGSRR